MNLALMATGTCSEGNGEAGDLLEDPKIGWATLTLSCTPWQIQSSAWHIKQMLADLSQQVQSLK